MVALPLTRDLVPWGLLKLDHILAVQSRQCINDLLRCGHVSLKTTATAAITVPQGRCKPHDAFRFPVRLAHRGSAWSSQQRHHVIDGDEDEYKNHDDEGGHGNNLELALNCHGWIFEAAGWGAPGCRGHCGS
jgi:hypothetical protein